MEKQFMFSAFTTPEGLESGDYSKDYLWANGGNQNGQTYGYGVFSHSGQFMDGFLTAQEYPTSTSVKATYMNEQTKASFTMEVDASARTAVITQGDVIIHDALYPPYPSYLMLTGDDTVSQAA